mgnify:CR=1 FL=1
MKTSKWILLSASLAVAMAGFIMLTGCEDEPSADVEEMGDYQSDSHNAAYSDQVNEGLEITPGGWTFTSGYAEDEAPGGVPSDLTGLKVTFTASGGVPPYGEWWVAHSTIGTIDPITGVYTVDGDDEIGENLVSISDSVGHVASVTVITEFEDTTTAPLAILPEDSTLTLSSADDLPYVINYTVSGGTPSYTWSATIPALGTIDEDSGVYTALSSGENTIVVTDGNGQQESTTITIELE